MIVALHVATGAATGALTRSRIAAVAIGPVLHVASDRVPHRHLRHASVDYLTGLLALAALVRRRGGSDAATLGALAAVMPDAEHLVPGLRPRGARVFHRRDAAAAASRAGSRRASSCSSRPRCSRLCCWASARRRRFTRAMRLPSRSRTGDGPAAHRVEGGTSRVTCRRLGHLPGSTFPSRAAAVRRYRARANAPVGQRRRAPPAGRDYDRRDGLDAGS